MKSQIRDTLIIVCTAGTIATAVAPMTTSAPPEWRDPLKVAGIVLAAGGIATINLTKADR
jgi:hypothetical protein